MTETASKPLFRIGGVYLNEHGAPCRIVDGDVRSAHVALARCGMALDGHWRLSDGRHIEAASYFPNSGLDLIPGELHQVNGEWVAVEEAKPANLYDPDEYTTEQRDWILYGKRPAIPESLKVPHGYGRNDSGGCMPLTWAESKPFNAFPGFLTFSTTGCGSGYASGGPLQRLSDTSTPLVDPSHCLAVWG